METMQFLEFMQGMLTDMDHKFVFGITIYVGLSFFDLILGILCGVFTDGFVSRKLELGIVKKVALVVFLLLCIPIAVIIGDVGVSGLWVAILGMIGAQMVSIFENFRKLDGNDSDIKPLEQWFNSNKDKKDE